MGTQRGRAVVVGGMLLAAIALPASPDQSDDGGVAVALVGDRAITRAEYDAALARAARARFYHGAPEPGVAAEFRRQVIDDLVDRILLLAEADRRGIVADAAKIAATLAEYDRRYAGQPRWQAEGERLKAELARHLAEQERLSQLELRVRELPAPTAAEVAAYYAAHADVFTEPTRRRVSMILLRVDPSAPAPTWQAAIEEALRLRRRIDGGADFAELARLHSNDPSASQGGDMGYVHDGMLAPAAQAAVAALEAGAVTEPLRVLEGIVILRLDSVQEARLVPLHEAEARARALCARDAADRAWRLLKTELRAAAEVVVYDTTDVGGA